MTSSGDVFKAFCAHVVSGERHHWTSVFKSVSWWPPTGPKPAARPLRQVRLQAGGCHVGLLRQRPLLQLCMQLPRCKVGSGMLRILRSDGSDGAQRSRDIPSGFALGRLC